MHQQSALKTSARNVRSREEPPSEKTQAHRPIVSMASVRGVNFVIFPRVLESEFAAALTGRYVGSSYESYEWLVSAHSEGTKPR
jgi:hypothetical protein